MLLGTDSTETYRRTSSSAEPVLEDWSDSLAIGGIWTLGKELYQLICYVRLFTQSPES